MKRTMDFQELSVFIDCSSGSTPTVAMLKQYIDKLSAFGYTHLYLGMMNALKLEGEPYLNFCRSGYSVEQLQEIDTYAAERGIELRAAIDVLENKKTMRQHACYDHLYDTLRAWMVGDEAVYNFIDKMFASMSEAIRSRKIHIGVGNLPNPINTLIDIGDGRYLSKHGLTERSDILKAHLERVMEIAKKYGYTCEMWSELFYRLKINSEYNDNGFIPEEAKDIVPKGISLVHCKFDKQSEEVIRKQIAETKELGDDLVYAGGARKWHGLAPDNKYSIDTMERQIAICTDEGIKRYMVTLWTEQGGHCSLFAVLPALFAVAEMASGKLSQNIDKNLFKEIMGVDYDEFMLLDNLNNPFFKDIETLNSRCHWGFMSDPLLGCYDLLLDEQTNEAYAELAERYASVTAGEYQSLFEEFHLYAKVLSYKMNMGARIRQAYRDGNKELLKQYLEQYIPEMLEVFELFTERFKSRWLNENMAFGLEIHLLYYGGQKQRWKYIMKRIKQYLEDGLLIEEIEREELEPSLIPKQSEDSLLKMSYINLITYSHF